ncbi:hypothetical protein AALA00_05035 [Lachnospiraceae bacterium 46-15]
MNNKRPNQTKSNQMKARFFAGFSCAAYGFSVLIAIVSSNLPGSSVWKEAFGSIVEIGFLIGVLLTFIWSICKPAGYPFPDEEWASMTQEELEELEKLAQGIMTDLK